jgi:hypothetical protein
MSLEKWGPWDEGIRYDVRIGEVLWYDQDQYHGRVPVEIRDRETGVVLKRAGDVKVIGNFSPIWVSIHGLDFQLTELLRLEHSVTKAWVKAEKRRREFQRYGIERPGPKDWLPD